MMVMLIFIFFMIPLCLCDLFWVIQFYLLVVMLYMMVNLLSIFFMFFYSYGLMMDMLSYSLILLSLWVTVMMLMSSQKINFFKFNYFMFNVMILVILILLLLTFTSSNMFMFYFFFEGSLIPVYLLILGWGYQPERLTAGVYLLFYTLFASLPMMVGIFKIYFDNFSMMMLLLKNYKSKIILFYLVMLLAFLIKMPMFMVHLWLPKAHVEAPVSGSMILAGVMLKLGGYGIIRFMSIFEFLSIKLNLFWILLSLIGGLYVSFFCFQQTDMKMLVAYSSVTHMAYVIMGLLMLSYLGFYGGLILMIGHGLCSSGLFSLINMIYERSHSRNIYFNKGLLNFLPSLSLWWFLLLSSNMAAPPSLNLMGEISLLMVIVAWSSKFILCLMLISFFSAGYSLYLFAFTQHGKFNLSMVSMNSVSMREYLIMFMHWVPLNLMILKLDFMLI